MSVNRNKSLLLHILDDVQDIQAFIQGITKEEFIQDKKTKKAVCMSLINIGEKVNKLPVEYYERNKEIPWNSIIGVRNRIAHGYDLLDNDILWDISSNHMEQLEKVIKKELKQFNKEKTR